MHVVHCHHSVSNAKMHYNRPPNGRKNVINMQKKKKVISAESSNTLHLV